MYTISCPKCHRDIIVLSRCCNGCGSRIVGRQRIIPSYQSRVFLSVLPVAGLLALLIYHIPLDTSGQATGESGKLATSRLVEPQTQQMAAQTGKDQATSGSTGSLGASSSESAPIAAAPEELDLASTKINSRCKSAWSTLSQNPENSISIWESRQIIEVFHIRQPDGSSLFYGCKFAGNRIIWRGKMDDDWSQWKTHKFDSNISYKIENNELHVSDSGADGSGQTIVFGKKDF